MTGVCQSIIKKRIGSGFSKEIVWFHSKRVEILYTTSELECYGSVFVNL